MNEGFVIPGGIQDWFLRASWQAALLAVLVMAVQWVFRRQLTPAWRYRLWLLVILRLVLPIQMQSPASVHNLASIAQDRLAGTAPSPVKIPAEASSAVDIRSGAPLGETARSHDAGVLHMDRAVDLGVCRGVSDGSDPVAERALLASPAP